MTWSAALQGLTIGGLVSLLFSIVPLLHVRFIKPSLLLRDESIAQPRDWVGSAAIAGVAAALVAVAVWQAASLEIGLVVCAGFTGLAFVLYLAGRALVSVVAPLANSRSFPLRHAVLHLSRPGNQTRVILLAVGLGAFFIVGIRSLQASLLERVLDSGVGRFARHVPARHPEGAGRRGPRLPRRRTPPAARGAQLLPVLRARVVGTGRREYTVTYRDHLESNERILDGTFWEGPSAGARGLDRGGHPRAARTTRSATRMPFDILGADRQRPRHEHPRGGVARLAQRRVHVRVQAGRARRSCRRRSSRRSRGRTSRPIAPAFSTIWSRRFPTCR